jgi:hypothetical protein
LHIGVVHPIKANRVYAVNDDDSFNHYAK